MRTHAFTAGLVQVKIPGELCVYRFRVKGKLWERGMPEEGCFVSEVLWGRLEL